MTKQKIIFYIPRTLVIIFIGFISLFSLDMFGTDVPIWQQLVGFLIHSIPSFLLILFLIVSWKKPLRGAIFFFLMSVMFFIMFDGYESLIGFLVIDLPLLVISGLFLLDYKSNKL